MLGSEYLVLPKRKSWAGELDMDVIVVIFECSSEIRVTRVWSKDSETQLKFLKYTKKLSISGFTILRD